jgi:hypothetical protein
MTLAESLHDGEAVMPRLSSTPEVPQPLRPKHLPLFWQGATSADMAAAPHIFVILSGTTLSTLPDCCSCSVECAL